MQKFRRYYSRNPGFIRSILCASSILLLGACGSGSVDVDTESDQSAPLIGAANSAQSSAETGPAGTTDTGNTAELQVPAEVETPDGSETNSEGQTTNLAPIITDTSYNCDPVVESASFTVGETDQFTLTVSDESPLTLTYSADSSNLDTVNVTVDVNGVFTVTALQPGESYLWLGAEDENGLADEYELKVIVN